MTSGAAHTSVADRARLWLARDTTSGALLLIAAALALAWANSPWRASYQALSEFTLGPEQLHLSLPLATWAADGVLAIFFFMVGLELKQEIVVGSLSKIREAAVPVLAAVGGMAAPAIIFTSVILISGEREALAGWAIPTATDIAFALGVLAIFGRGLPRGLRIFLLTLAVVDDLLAIIIIAIFYTSDLNLAALAGAFVVIALYGILVRSRRPRWWFLIPIAAVAWALMHESGVHATIAGVMLGFTVPARPVHGESYGRTHTYDDAVRPISSGFALPVFAFFSAGVSLLDGDGPAGVLSQPVVVAIVLGLVLGKLIGVMGTTWIVTRLTPLELPGGVRLRQLVPVCFLTGIGFTVALLIAELSFDDGDLASGSKIAILMASMISAILAAIVLRHDARSYAQVP